MIGKAPQGVGYYAFNTPYGETLKVLEPQPTKHPGKLRPSLPPARTAGVLPPPR